MSTSNVLWLVAVKGSLHWWPTDEAKQGHQVKGTIVFEALSSCVLSSKSEPRYWLWYNGDTQGTLLLPYGLWQLVDSKFEKQKCQGKSHHVMFEPYNSEGLDRFQLSIPPITSKSLDGSTINEGRLIINAIKHAQAAKSDYEEQLHCCQLERLQT
jgi:hypothetical protein